jgi:hypothetical protein
MANPKPNPRPNPKPRDGGIGSVVNKLFDKTDVSSDEDKAAVAADVKDTVPATKRAPAAPKQARRAGQTPTAAEKRAAASRTTGAAASDRDRTASAAPAPDASGVATDTPSAASGSSTMQPAAGLTLYHFLALAGGAIRPS